MRVSAKTIPWSGIVGGGVQLLDPQGKPCFIVAFIGTQQSITKEETQALSKQLVHYINNYDVIVPERKQT